VVNQAVQVNKHNNNDKGFYRMKLQDLNKYMPLAGAIIEVNASTKRKVR